jgi:hypothetical protein
VRRTSAQIVVSTLSRSRTSSPVIGLEL